MRRAVAALQYLRAPTHHDGALGVDRARDTVRGAGEVGARASRDHLLHAGIGPELDAEVELLEPGIRHAAGLNSLPG